jgi:hypothetical protein
VSQGAETIIGEWGPHDPFDERAFFSCSPHRVEYAAHLISNGYLDDYADRAIRLLPDWVQWCAERSRISAEAADRRSPPRVPQRTWPRKRARTQSRTPCKASLPTAERSRP